MPEQVPFIGREDELHWIDRLINEWGTCRILCIHAEGGIGKTRLLQEVRNRYIGKEQSRRIISDIIDFDDQNLHLLRNLGYKLATELNEYIFQPYLQGLIKHRKMELQGMSYTRLREAFLENFKVFYNCFNSITREKRIVLLFDTTDALQGEICEGFFAKLGESLQNTLILLAGRNARMIGEDIQKALGKNETIQIIDLQPLEAEIEAERYLQQKQELLHITIEPELRQTLLLLTGGKPILIDLAVEWRARGISLNWLVKKDPGFAEEDIETRRREFERQMVIHIAQCRRHMDDLILLMSRMYPLNAEMILQLLDLSQKEAETLFEEAKTYVFVKCLPDGKISLHDEMRRMVNEYVWHEVDPEGDRRRYESQLVAGYLEKKIAALTEQALAFARQEKIASEQGEAEAEFKAFTQREILEREIWMFKRQHLQHIFVVDFDKGITVFAKNFDEATQKCQFSFRESLLSQMQQYAEPLSKKPKERYILDSRCLTYLFDKSKYSQADELATKILQELDMIPEQRLNTLIIRANVNIRLGKITSGVDDFRMAVDVSKSHHLSVWHIKALNGLGWAYRQTGKLTQAQQYYLDARYLYFGVSEQEKQQLQDDYGWISNNLAFALSNNNQTRRTAINIARSNLKHWQSIDHKIGLGACQIVLGIAYYRYDTFDPALKAFQEALNIFKPLELNDWLGQIYSWRGSLYRDLGDLENAERDLQQSLAIGSSNIEAMTLYCLGRVYMTQQKWDLAAEYMQKSFARAQQIPDYRYWLASVTRMIEIAAEKEEYHRLEELDQLLEACLMNIENPEKNAQGIAYIGLAKLAFMKNDLCKQDMIKEYARKGIAFINESYYAHADVLGQLEFIEKDFQHIKPEIIRAVGKFLLKFSREKEREKLDYIAITPIMDRWATWEKQKRCIAGRGICKTHE